MKRLILAALLGAGIMGTGVGTASAADAALQTAIAATTRTPANVARDVYRHPYETLTFFGIQPTMTVVELIPGGGWYTEILAPYLRDKGKYIGAGAPVDPVKRTGMAFKNKVDSNPAIYDKVLAGVFDPPRTIAIAPAGSADMVLTFRNVHNWMGGGDAEMVNLFKKMYEVLKPGGVLGVVEHRLPESATQDATASTGYVKQSYVIGIAEKAGFRLAAKSEINANPKDNAQHKGGVWALPPTYANKDEDRGSYQAIGESDRMTLKFVKPGK
jgi:predicted methyltransferase